jgi:hypothetical protein
VRKIAYEALQFLQGGKVGSNVNELATVTTAAVGSQRWPN